MPNAYGDLTTLKSAGFLNVPDDTHDGRLLGLLEATSRWIDGYCDRSFAAVKAERRFDGTGKVALAVPDLIAVSTLRVRDAASGEWLAWPSGRWLLYPLNAAPTEPGGRPYTRVMAAGHGRRFPLSRGGVSINGLWGYGDVREDLGLQVAAASPVTAGDATVKVAAADGTMPSGLAPGHTARIGSEQLYVTNAVADTAAKTLTLTVRRGVNGTAPAAHGVAAGVSVYRYPKGVAEACLLQAAVRWRERLTGPFRPPGGDSWGDVGGVSPTVRALLEPYRRRVAGLGV